MIGYRIEKKIGKNGQVIWETLIWRGKEIVWAFQKISFMDAIRFIINHERGVIRERKFDKFLRGIPDSEISSFLKGYNTQPTQKPTQDNDTILQGKGS